MNSMNYKCPNCGAPLTFDSSTQDMSCAYCGNHFPTETMEQYEECQNRTKPSDDYKWEDYKTKEFHSEEKEGMVERKCPSCGGEIICEETTAATSCPYCGNATVITSTLSGVFRPDLVIPFKLDKDAAKAALLKHCSHKPLLPRFFRDKNRIESISGVYVPFWLFDCGANGDVNYRATRTMSWSDSQFNYTKTDFYSVFRSGSAEFQMVPEDGSKKMDDALMESIEPFDYSRAVDFQTTFLSGYLADKYDVDSEESKPRVNERVKNSLESLLRDTVRGYMTVTPTDSNIRIQGGKISYALLPVWMLNTVYRDKTYTFAMNGQTGKFVGDLPVSTGRFISFFLGFTALFASILYCIFYLL